MNERDFNAMRYIRKCERRRERKNRQCIEAVKALAQSLPPFAVGMLVSALVFAAIV